MVVVSTVDILVKHVNTRMWLAFYWANVIHD